MTAKHGIPWLNVCACPGKHHSSDCKAPRGMTWNPIRGCTKTNPGCKNCYAILDAARQVRIGRGSPDKPAKPGNVRTGASYARCLNDKQDNWNGHIELVPELLSKPLSWKQPRTVFVNSMSDLFHPAVPFEFIAAVFAVMAATPRHKYVILTKRPERALEFFAWWSVASGWPSVGDFPVPSAIWNGVWPLSNVTIGVSISDQETADRLLPLLARVPAKTRAVSAEPLLRQVDISRWLEPRFEHTSKHCDALYETRPGIDWLIIGAENAHKDVRRPCELKHAQDLARQVLDAQVVCDRCHGDGFCDDPTTEPYTCRKCLGSPRHGPALYIKQLDVCERCDGSGKAQNAFGERLARKCAKCAGSGQTGTLRKDCPALHIPGHGAQQWRQFPVGWRP